MGSLSFLTPLGALVALAGVIPVIVYLGRERRAREVRRTLGLPEPSPRSSRALFAALVAVPLLAGVAAAQPVLDRAEPRLERLDAELLFAFDTTGSMYASAGPREPTRFDRARGVAEQVRAGFPRVRAGVLSLTNRALPHLFPTIDGSSFRSTVARSVTVEPPGTGTYAVRATDLNALASVANQAYFSPGVRTRVLVVLTDGESRRVRAALPVALRRAGIRTVFVHVWRRDESIFVTSRADRGYRPDPRSRQTLDEFAAAVDGAVFSESELARVVAHARRELGDGPTRPQRQRDLLALMPWATAAAALPLALLLRRRNL